MIQINQKYERSLILVSLLKKHYNAKITELEGKIPDVSDLAKKTALTATENKILVVQFRL